MEAAIRWAPGPTPESQRFLLVDVAGNSITLNQSRTAQNGDLISERIARYDKVPNFTAFDWSKSDTNLLALGLSSGDASLLTIDANRHTVTPIQVFPIRTQRKANSIAFNNGRLLAVGHDRVRNDHCLTVYDVDGGKEAHSRLCTGEAVSSVRFFPHNPQEVIAAVARSTLKIYDLRDPSFSSTNNASTVFTKQVHNIAIDPTDSNYFATGGSTGDPTVSIWDRRWLSSSGSEGGGSASILDLRPAVDNSQTATVWSIRFSGLKRGRFGVLSSTGAVRLYDVTSHSVEQNSRLTTPANFHGGNAWNGPQYIARTHDVQYPYYDKYRGHDESSRVIAFDWVTEGAAEGQSIMALRLTREVNMLHAPNPQFLEMTPRGDLGLCREDIMIIEPDNERLTDKVVEVERVLDKRRGQSLDHLGQPLAGPATLNAKALEKLREPGVPLQRTEHWLHGNAEANTSPKTKLEHLADTLAAMNVHKWRCHEGYRFDCDLNKQIVRDDPKLERLWTNIGHFEKLAAHGNMTSERLDLSFFGVQNIWNGRMDDSRHRVLPGATFSNSSFESSLVHLNKLRNRPEIQALPKSTYQKRALSLELCGWTWSHEAMQRKCEHLVGRRQFYRAIALAFFDGYHGIALDLLKNLAKSITDNGLGVLLASDKVTEKQKEICMWMEAEASDPYLKAMLRYISHQDWHGLVNNEALHLSDRVSLALQYLNDSDLTAFINKTAEECVAAGDVAGILLTGLTESSIPLFQNYLARTGDLQTAVLATSFTSPLYMTDSRLAMWREMYLDMLQAWRCFVERARFNVEHAKRSVRRDGTKTIAPAARQIGLRCLHCNASLARPAEEQGQKAVMGFESAAKGQGSQMAARLAEGGGTICPRCGRHLPRCAVCLQWLGTPELLMVAPRKGSRVGGEGEQSKLAAAAQKAKETDMALSRFVTFCASCGHGLHAHHARQWFAKHGMCPVPDCGCLCGVRR